MSIKKSIILSDLTLRSINSRKSKNADEILWSQAVNNSFQKNEWLIKELLPQMAGDEWKIILNVYTGCWLEDFQGSYRISSDIMDDVGVINIDELSKEYRDMVKKMHKLTQAEQWAITEVVHKFWCGNFNEFENINDIIKHITNI